MKPYLCLTLLILLTAHPLASLPLPGTADPREIAAALPSNCRVVLAVKMTPEQWRQTWGARELEQIANNLGAQDYLKRWNGGLFACLYEGQPVWGLDDGTEWNLLLPYAVKDAFTREESSLRDQADFALVTEPWKLGPFLLYVGDLSLPDRSILELFEEYPEMVPTGLKSPHIKVPHLCLGTTKDGRLQGWVGPLAPEARVGDVWNPLIGRLPALEKSARELSVWLDELAEHLMEMSISLPLEWKVLLFGRQRFAGWGARALPLAFLEGLDRRMPSGETNVGPPALESLTCLGEGLWHYQLDPWSSRRVLEEARSLLAAAQAPTPEPSPEKFCCSNLKNIGTALEMYSVDHDGRYPDNLEDLVPDYLHTLPPCPKAGSETSYGYRKEGNRYLVFCEGRRHSSADYPRYTSEEGLVEDRI